MPSDKRQEFISIVQTDVICFVLSRQADPDQNNELGNVRYYMAQAWRCSWNIPEHTNAVDAADDFCSYLLRGNCELPAWMDEGVNRKGMRGYVARDAQMAQDRMAGDDDS